MSLKPAIQHHDSPSRRGFTMIELMISIVIVAILATVGTAMYNELLSPAYGTEIKAALTALRKAQRAYESSHGFYATSKQQLIDAGYMEKEDFSGLNHVQYDSLKLKNPAEHPDGVVALWDGTARKTELKNYNYSQVKLKMNGEWIEVQKN